MIVSHCRQPHTGMPRVPVCWLLGLFLLTTGINASADAAAPSEAVQKTGSLTKITIQGRVVCLHEELHQRYGMDMPTQHRHVYGFKTKDDQYFLLLENNLSGALFQDPVVRKRELILTAWLFPDSQIIDVVTMKSIKDGTIHDRYYYCVICAIRTAVPGPCMCCQDDVERVETPLKPLDPSAEK